MRRRVTIGLKKLFGNKSPPRDYGWGAFCSERVVNPEFLWPGKGGGER